MLSGYESVTWVKIYPVDSLQIYFAGSLEIQEELINHGFYVPKSPDGKIVMPIPIIYSNFRGWLRPAEPVTIERIIPPEWLGLKFNELNWRKTSRNGREAYVLPEEEVYVNMGISENAIIFDLIIKSYHLERTSIRGVNPDKWTNWAMFYIGLEYIDELIEVIESHIYKYTKTLLGLQILGGASKPRREVQQGGKEVAYYVEVSVKDFSFCLGCFDLAQRYLYMKAREHCKIDPLSEICRNPDRVIEKLRLRLKYDPSVNTFAKVGIAKISGKRPQIMIKLASTKSAKIIKGVLKERVEGKARGNLVYCDHKVKKQYIVLELAEFYKALVSTKRFIDKLPKEE